MVEKPAVRVRHDEVVLLVMGFLQDEAARFPASKKAFEEEAANVLQSIMPKKRNVKTLHAILEEYLQLKMEKEQRMELASTFERNPQAAHKVVHVMESIKTLLADYELMREATLLHSQPDPHITAQEGSLPEKRPAPETPSVQNHAGTQSLETPETVSASTLAENAPATQSPERKRRKGVPMQNCRSPSSGRKSKPRINAARAQWQTLGTGDGTAGQLLDAEPARDPPCAVAGSVHPAEGMPTIYSDISESVLSDPQVTQLLEGLGTADDLFDILGDTDFSKLVEPLTHHINAKLAVESSEGARGSSEGSLSLPPGPSSLQDGRAGAAERACRPPTTSAETPLKDVQAGPAQETSQSAWTVADQTTAGPGEVVAAGAGEQGQKSEKGHPETAAASTKQRRDVAGEGVAPGTDKGKRLCFPDNVDMQQFLRALHSGAGLAGS